MDMVRALNTEFNLYRNPRAGGTIGAKTSTKPKGKKEKAR
jgi:hypothetical protein